MNNKKLSITLVRKFLARELGKIGFVKDTVLSDNLCSIFRKESRYVHATHYNKYDSCRLIIRFGIINRIVEELLVSMSVFYERTLWDPKNVPSYWFMVSEKREDFESMGFYNGLGQPGIFQPRDWIPEVYLPADADVAEIKIAKCVSLNSCIYKLLESVPSLLPCDEPPWFMINGVIDDFVLLALAIERGIGAEQLERFVKRRIELESLPNPLQMKRPDWRAAMPTLSQFILKYGNK